MTVMWTLGKMKKLIKSEIKLTRIQWGYFSNIHNDFVSYQKASFDIAFHDSYLSRPDKRVKVTAESPAAQMQKGA